MNNISEPQDDEIDLLDLWRTLWDSRRLVMAITAVFSLGGVTYSLLAEPRFSAETTLMPANAKTTGGSGLGAALGGLGGLASLAGVSIGGAGNSEALAVLKSNDFQRGFIQEQNLMPLFFPKNNKSEGKDIRDGLKFLQGGVLVITEDKKSSLLKVVVSWKDPEVAAVWANALVRRLNSQMRERAINEATANIAYLQQEMASASVVSLQQAVGRLLESEMQKMMLAKGGEEFAYKIIDQATPPKIRVSPKRAVISTVSFLAGIFLSILVVFVRKAWLDRRKLI